MADDPDQRGIGHSARCSNELQLSQDSLRALSEETGGFAVGQPQRLPGPRSIASSATTARTTCWRTTRRSDKTDGKFHRIEVRVNRPGLTVRSRRGYVAPQGQQQAAAPEDRRAARRRSSVEALNSPIQVSGLTMRVFAAPFKGTAPNASVLVGVEMRGRDLAPRGQQQGRAVVPGRRREGQVSAAAKTDALTLNLRPETQARVEQTGLRFLNRMDLPPGRYQLRVAAHDTVGGASARSSTTSRFPTSTSSRSP